MLARVFLLVLLITTHASCAHTRSADAPPLSAEAGLERLEQRLLAASDLRIRYHVRAEGAVGAELDGELILNGQSEVELTATGSFANKPVELRLSAAGGRMRGGSAEQSFEEPAPESLRAALLLGLTRMGILHNLARLTGGLPPDHAGGGVEEWVRPEDVSWTEPVSEEERQGLHFGIRVAGQRAGEASLWLDADGLPHRRTQVVAFPGGQMTVLEEYEVF